MNLKLLVIANILLFCQQECYPATVYKFTNVECVVNSKYIVNQSCSIKAVNWNKATATLDFYLIRSIHNVSIHMRLFKKDYTNQYQPFLIDVQFNLCNVISKRNSLVYGSIVWKTMKRFTSLNHSCPLDGHLFSRNLYIDESYVPSFPFGMYKLSLNFTETIQDQMECLGVITFYFQSMEKYQSKRKNLKIL
ncbi:hypothetical protein KR044_008121 [Drosophila immigrans]|nr:hypothetical protein KR044_008121 [Drosophila immigrans]